ncbi:AAA family ATPase [Aeromonas sp. QDB17]|uniref:AAA family ATPase n=1 Tax=Aeromonas sp. QDB17 TaxID=2990485 RepID=UPI0022E31795|nr:AAA family ATPase [Aeromonas sp. QDB17]
MSQIELIEIKNHPVFRKKKIEFKNFDHDKNIFTVIIGQNGCGKSELLRVIADSVNSHIIYNSNIGSIKVDTAGDITFKNGEIPQKVLASSFSLNDKFPILTRRNKLYHEDYEYLGLRSTSNNAFVGKYKKEFLKRLVNVLSEERRLDAFTQVLAELNIPLQFKFSFKYGRGLKTILDSSDEANTYHDFDSKVDNFISNKLKKSRLDYEKLYERLKSSHFKTEIYSFIKSKSKRFSSLEYRVDLSNPIYNDKFMQDSAILINLIESGVIQINDFSFTTVNDYSFSVASSGQHHLFTEMLNIASSIVDNSLLLIDEPEISLHPNWQIRYIELLEIITSSFSKCHTIICTHSHFLLSSINEDVCSIMHTKRTKDGDVEITECNQNTFGWSPEQVLYNVFGLSTTRNHYFERDLRLIVNILSRVNKNKEEIHEPLERIKRFNITDDDPLKLLINRADEFIKRM